MFPVGRLESIVPNPNKEVKPTPVGATFRIPASEFALGRALTGLDEYYAELTQFVPTEDQFIPYVWIENGDLRKVESTLEEQTQVEQITKYDKRVGRALYAIKWAPPLDDFISILLNGKCLVTNASGTPDFWSFEVLALNQDDLGAFQSACIAGDIPIDVQKVRQSGIATRDKNDMTIKQREILLMAYEQGYFEIPREVTVTDLAKDLGISPQAASNRMRRGLQSMITDAIFDIKEE